MIEKILTEIADLENAIAFVKGNGSDPRAYDYLTISLNLARKELADIYAKQAKEKSERLTAQMDSLYGTQNPLRDPYLHDESRLTKLGLND